MADSAIKGEDLGRILESYGWRARELAELLDMHETAICRARHGAFNPEGLKVRFLVLLRDGIPEGRRADVGAQVSAELALGGSLPALHYLLNVYFGEVRRKAGGSRC
jgi:hypothetical protein